MMTLPQTVVVSPAWVRAQNPADWLTSDEMTVLAAWRSGRRQAEWLAGRLAAKKLMQEEWAIAPGAWSVGREGVAPAFTGLELPYVVMSLSHSDGLGAASFSDTRMEGSVGIDVQHIRPVHAGLCARVYSGEERNQIAGQFGSEDSAVGMLLFWTLKEAAIKARRLAWGRPLQSILVRLTPLNQAEIIMEGEPLLTAQYERLGEWWLARAAVRTYPAVSRRQSISSPSSVRRSPKSSTSA